MEVDNANVPSTTEQTTDPEEQSALQNHVQDTATNQQQQQQQVHHDNGGSATHKRVLIAVDRSKYSDGALRWYAMKLHTPGDQVLFLNVAEPPEMALGFGMAGPAVAEIYTKAMEETIENARRLASNIKETCRSLGIEKMRFLERIGHGAGQAIVEVADEEQVDLIVLGSRGVGLLRRTFIGSVSDYVLHHSKRAAVTVVPTPIPCVQDRMPDSSANECHVATKITAAAAAHADNKQD